LRLAKELRLSDSRAARWVGADAVRELARLRWLGRQGRRGLLASGAWQPPELV